MLGLDTNILLRLLTQDDAVQSPKAQALFDRHAEHDNALFVSDMVLGELVWTLERTYGYLRAEIQQCLMALLNNATLAFESRETLHAALSLFAVNKAGFVDCMILSRSKAQGCERLLSFDKGMKSLPGVQLL